MRRVPAMIAEVINDHVVAIEQPPPERKVAVDRKPIAMTEHQARSAGDAMAALKRALDKDPTKVRSWIRADPMFDRLKGEPEFEQLFALQ